MSCPGIRRGPPLLAPPGALPHITPRHRRGTSFLRRGGRRSCHAPASGPRPATDTQPRPSPGTPFLAPPGAALCHTPGHRRGPSLPYITHLRPVQPSNSLSTLTLTIFCAADLSNLTSITGLSSVSCD